MIAGCKNLAEVYYITSVFLFSVYRVDAGSNVDRETIQERRDLAVEFIFCLVLIEVLRQLAVHPGHDDLVRHIEDIAFKHFKYREG